MNKDNKTAKVNNTTDKAKEKNKEVNGNIKHGVDKTKVQTPATKENSPNKIKEKTRKTSKKI